MKKQLLIYPTPKNYKKINTHPNVCSFFLAKYLKKYYDIHKSSDPTDNPEWVRKLKKNNLGANSRRHAMISMIFKDLASRGNELDYCLTTIQRGFTRIDEDKINELRVCHPNVKLCSIHDHYGVLKYNEDYLFVAREAQSEKHIQALKSGAKNKSIQPKYMGWCADHKVFKSVKKKDNSFNIVLDHAALQDFRTDVTDLYLKAILSIKKEYPNKSINLCRLNKGFEFYDFTTNSWTHSLEYRWWKSEYDNDRGISNGEGCNVFQVAECLNNSHIFGVTHVESCGLTGIEALMGGCKLYIPKGKDKFVIWGTQGKGKESLGKYKNVSVGRFNGTFIKQDLLKTYMDYSVFETSWKEIFSQLKVDISNYKNRTDRGKLILNHSWMKAAERIYKGLENE